MKLLLTLILISSSFYSCNQNKNEHLDFHKQHQTKSETYYTCSMHPQIKEKGPGKCPICGMNLSKIEIEKEVKKTDIKRSEKEDSLYYCEANPEITSLAPGVCPIDGTQLIKKNKSLEVVAKVKLRKSQVRHFKADIFPVTSMKMQKKILLLGTLLKSEEHESSITARVPGRVEKVLIESTGQFIKKGDPVLKLYGPKLLTGAEEYLLARKNYFNDKSNNVFKELYEQSIERLTLWGVHQKQLDSWAKNNKIPREIIIYSPVTGIVEEKNAVEGKYFKEGQSFFKLVDLSKTWVEMDVYEHDSALVKIGEPVELKFSAYPGETWSGVIDFINPVLDPKTRTLKVRTTLDNSNGKLRPGMVGEATLIVKLPSTPLVVPRTAIIDTGKRKVIWLDTGNHTYTAKKIVTGFESEGYVEVKHGLKENDLVVIEGNFLLDAQAQLTGGYEDPTGETL
ncbi:MAG: efflux RND transporter periplasmic adaptor subunit [Halobacteriovoraceae bacterium]|nr:efflux RND transporter periplasmic adaptor subunit [Halobacteriovoraceae bacterium]